jgi:hypothetical protein
MEFDVALNLVKERRECICPIPAFVDQLLKYEMDCKVKGLIRATATTSATTTIKRKSCNVSSTSSDNQMEDEKRPGSDGVGNKKLKATSIGSYRTSSDTMDDEKCYKEEVDTVMACNKKHDEKKATATDTRSTSSIGKSTTRTTRQMGPSLPPGFKRG